MVKYSHESKDVGGQAQILNNLGSSMKSRLLTLGCIIDGHENLEPKYNRIIVKRMVMTTLIRRQLFKQFRSTVLVEGGFGCFLELVFLPEQIMFHLIIDLIQLLYNSFRSFHVLYFSCHLLCYIILGIWIVHNFFVHF